MKLNSARRVFAALAQETRLEAFRLLARVAPDGIPAGEIANRLDTPSSTLTFHLQQLVGSGLVKSTRSSRSVIYSLNTELVRELLWFLGEDCCQGRLEMCASPIERIAERAGEASKEDVRKSVLFICTGNSARSQMAEAILRDLVGDRMEALSCGLNPVAINPLTIRVLEEAGISTDGLYSKDISEFLGKKRVHVGVVVCDKANQQCPRIYPFAAELLYWPFDDPAAVEGSEDEVLAAFRTVRDQIKSYLEEWVGASAGERQSAGRLTPR